MADPVRVQRVESFQTSGPPATLVIGHVHPGELARAIRREMAAEIEIIRDDLRKGIDVDDALRWSHDRLTAPAPREPAQERQDNMPDVRVIEAPGADREMASLRARDLLAERTAERDAARADAQAWRNRLESLVDQIGKGNPRDDEGHALVCNQAYMQAVKALVAVAATLPSATPAGGADPLLPGLRAARDNANHMVQRTDTSPLRDWRHHRAWLAAEIARREGA